MSDTLPLPPPPDPGGVPAPGLEFRGDGPRPKARVTVVESVIYQQLDPPGEAVDLGSGGYSLPVFEPADEQCVPGRVQTVGPDWAPLQLLYLDGLPVAVLVVENLEGTGRQVLPSDAEAAGTAARVVELAVPSLAMHGPHNDSLPAFAVVRPGTSARFEPAARVHARCRSGRARVRVAAAPGEKGGV